MHLCGLPLFVWFVHMKYKQKLGWKCPKEIWQCGQLKYMQKIECIVLVSRSCLCWQRSNSYHSFLSPKCTESARSGLDMVPNSVVSWLEGSSLLSNTLLNLATVFKVSGMLSQKLVCYSPPAWSTEINWHEMSPVFTPSEYSPTCGWKSYFSIALKESFTIF